MIGILSVNKLLITYHALTLLFLAGFAAYDKRHHRIRNAALLAFLPWCLLSLPAAAYTCPGAAFPEAVLHSVLGSLSGFLLLLSVSLATDGGIGGGDIKLAALLGIPFGGMLSVNVSDSVQVQGSLFDDWYTKRE